MKKEISCLNEERNVTLTAYLWEDETVRPAILVLPGGGYRICADGEADPPAEAYARAGFQAFVLRYTVGDQCRWPMPLEDYGQAVRLLKSKAGEWHLDPDRIAVAGFSAGGHLAACAATMSEERPAAAVLVYPAILPDCMDHCLPGTPYPNEHVSESTCPCFFTAARDDDDVDIRNTLVMEQALAEKGIPFESHIYSVGGHAFSLGISSPWGHELTPRLKNWPEESIGWLREVL